MSFLMESDVFAAPIRQRTKTVGVHHDDKNAEELIRRISRLIKRETNLGVQEMKVRFDDGQVVISGCCRTFYTKQLAQEAVLAVIGEVRLVNNIRVV